MTTFILIVLAIILVAYLKTLDKDLRNEQLSTARDTATIGTIATLKFGKEFVKLVYNTGKTAALSVETNHAELSHDVRTSLDGYITNNGGTVKQAGIVTGEKAISAVYMDDMQKTVDDMYKDLLARHTANKK